ncbi:MAG: hypothetical protein JWM88_412 [Verrucomicrobia bacterium]|nr:hypothetical protein [Verrucomicrobiota bacterium]
MSTDESGFTRARVPVPRLPPRPRVRRSLGRPVADPPTRVEGEPLAVRTFPEPTVSELNLTEDAVGVLRVALDLSSGPPEKPAVSTTKLTDAAISAR